MQRKKIDKKHLIKFVMKEDTSLNSEQYSFYYIIPFTWMESLDAFLCSQTELICKQRLRI